MHSCIRCSKTDTEVYRLVKCAGCFKQVCEECAIRFYGRYFCSNTCAQNFFFIVEDE